MATAQALEESSVCSICFGKFTKPCSLPGCLHKFCENCLLTYITNLKSDDKDLTEFQCPNCRSQASFPESTDNLQTWIKSLNNLETDDDTLTERAAYGNWCIPCRGEDQAVSAEKFCIECQESLCARCSRIRHGPKVFKEHSIFDFQHLPKGLDNSEREKLLHALAEYLQCEKHTDKTVYYKCEDDNFLCCSDCVTGDHRYCANIISFEDAEVTPKTEYRVNEVKAQIERVASSAKVLVEARKQNIADSKRMSEEAIEKVIAIRKKINKIFDDVEENISSKTRSFGKQFALEVDAEIAKLNEVSRDLQDCANLIKFTETLGSSAKLFVVLDKLMLKVEKADKDISKISDVCTTFKLDIQIEPAIQKLLDVGLHDTSQVMSITESFIKTDSMQTQHQNRHTCIIGKFEKIDEKVILPNKNGCSYPAYYSVVYPEGTEGMFLVSLCLSHEMCFLTDERLVPEKCFVTNDLSGKPFCATNLKNSTVAVSVPEKNKITFISKYNEITGMKISGHINTTYKPMALYGLRNGDIAVSWNNPAGFGILSFKPSLYGNIPYKENTYFRQDTGGREIKTFDFMAVDEKRTHVIQPCTVEKAVFCFDFEGNPQFKYSHEDLVYPRGVSISGDGNIFVCDKQKSVIHVLSPGGNGLYVLRDGCPAKPLAIAFDRSGSQFIVSQECEPWKVLRVFRMS